MALRKRGDNFLNLLQKEGVPRKEGFPQKRRGVLPTLQETMVFYILKTSPELEFELHLLSKFFILDIFTRLNNKSSAIDL